MEDYGTWANHLHLGWQGSMRDAQHAWATGQQLAEGAAHAEMPRGELLLYILLTRHVLFQADTRSGANVLCRIIVMPASAVCTIARACMVPSTRVRIWYAFPAH